MTGYDATLPWNQGVRGQQVLPLINDDAPVLRVEAGPGAGKTFGLARRVHRIVDPRGLGVDPARVLVVAFNRVIARDLYNAIHERLRESDVEGRPEVRTIHGFCLRLVGSSERLLLPHEREAMIFDVLHRYPELREQYGSSTATQQALRNHEAGHSDEAALWQACRRWLAQHAANLVGDLPGDVRDRLRGGDFADVRFDHVIVDEFQDLTPSEQELVTLLRAEGGQLLALGDPRQSIYAFRGNDRTGLRNLERLTQQPVVDIPMTECQRCPPEIVRAANQLTVLDPATPMDPASEEAANVHLVHWTTPNSEAAGMAAAIARNIVENPEDRHLVMVTRRAFGYDLLRRLSEEAPDVPVELSFSESILELWPVREAFLWLSLLADPDPATWRAWLGYQNTPPNEKSKAPQRNAPAYDRHLAKASGRITAEVVVDLAQEDEGANRGLGGMALWGRATRYVELLGAQDWASMSAYDLAAAALSDDLWANDADATARSDLAQMRTHVLGHISDVPNHGDPERRSAVLKEAIDDLRYVIATREPLSPVADANLRIATLWGAKGLTAEHVYVLGVCQEALPGLPPSEYPGTDEEHSDEQRRLFYVTLTRSKRTLVLSRATKVKWGDANRIKLSVSERADDYHAKLNMSPFLRDIAKYLPASQPGADWSGCGQPQT